MRFECERVGTAGGHVYTVPDPEVQGQRLKVLEFEAGEQKIVVTVRKRGRHGSRDRGGGPQNQNRPA